MAQWYWRYTRQPNALFLGLLILLGWATQWFMELRHLRYFVAVASHGSFNRAAEVLSITQPPLSRQVRDLEEHLGVPLLIRGTNSLKLTEAGELFYEEAREVLARADDAVRRMRGETGKEILRVGYAPSMTGGIMSAALARFQAAAPGVRIELADLSSREINEMAATGRLDLVVAPGVSVTKGIPGFQLTELRRLQIVLVVSERHPLAKLKRIPVGRMHQLPLVGLAKDNYPEYVPTVRGMFKPSGVTLRFISLVNDGLCTLFEELEARNAGAIFAEGISGMLPRTLVMRPFAPKLPSAPVMIGLPTLHPKPHAQTFARLLIEQARNQ
jgi:DNA-binding transcriptional LysR family regulator